MIKGHVVDRYNENNDLNIDNILKKITAYDIYRFYTPFSFKLGQAYQSPLREDHDPSFSIKQSKSTGQIYHLDYSQPEYGGNCFQYVQGRFHCDFNNALIKINDDFQLGLGSSNTIENPRYLMLTKNYEQPEKITQYKRIDVFDRKLTFEEIAYWNKRFINSDELKKDYIFGIDKLFLNGKRITNPKKLLRFGYYFPKLNKWKIYTPYADKKKGEYKWISNLSLDVIERLNSIVPDKGCVGTKSRKDRIILQKFLPNVFSCQNESEVAISIENIIYIREHSKKCYLFYDNDNTGVKSCKYYNQFGLDYINIPKSLGVKDPDEMVVKYGLNAFEDFLKNNKII